MPEDEADLALFLPKLPADMPVTVIGLGSNLLIRDGGVPGVVIRLSARGFGQIEPVGESRIRVGAAVPDKRLAGAAFEAGLSGFAFYHGIPGGIGGALRMNAGAHGSETRQRVVEIRAVRRSGEIRHARQCRHGLRLSPFLGPGRPRLRVGPVRGHAGRSGDDPPRHGRRDRASRKGPADQIPHRRLDLQESRRPLSLEADRRGRMPRADDRRRPGLGAALQLPDQHRGGQRPRPWNSSARPCVRPCCAAPASVSNGRSSASAPSRRDASWSRFSAAEVRSTNCGVGRGIPPLQAEGRSEGPGRSCISPGRRADLKKMQPLRRRSRRPSPEGKDIAPPWMPTTKLKRIPCPSTSRC